MGDHTVHYVEVNQYLRPNGQLKKGSLPVSKGHYDKAVKYGMVISAEVLRTDEVALYARAQGWEEENELLEIALNDGSERGVQAKLEKLIDNVEAKAQRFSVTEEGEG